MSPNRADKTQHFHSLHRTDKPLLMPNPWDAGTTAILESLGFAALATTSLGASVAAGRKRASLAELLTNLGIVCQSTTLAVNADLENGYVDSPDELYKTIDCAYELGATGFSIEDTTFDPGQPIYDFNLSVERVAAAVEYNRSLPVPMVFTARADNLISGVRDMDDTIRRLQAYDQAGADVLYAPGLKTLDEIHNVTREVTKPVNVVMGFADPAITVADLSKAGVCRISIGGALCRAVMRTFIDSSTAMLNGRFSFVEAIASVDEIDRLIR